MESITFKSRQQFLSEFFNKDRVDFLKTIKSIKIEKEYFDNRTFNEKFILETYVKFNYLICDKFKIFCKFLKSFTYFLYSFTYYENFLYDKFLFFSRLNLNLTMQIFNNNELVNKDVNFNIKYPSPEPYSHIEDYNFLRSIKTEDIFNDSIKNIIRLEMRIQMGYFNINREEYIYLGGIDEEERREQQEQQAQHRQEVQAQRREAQKRGKIINSSQCFKSDRCVICLTNTPNVLFCNCGHICFCSECEKLKYSNLCPICKTENKIIRVLN